MLFPSRFCTIERLDDIMGGRRAHSGFFYQPPPLVGTMGTALSGGPDA